MAMTSLWELSQQQQQQDGTGNPVLDEALRINESSQRVYDRIRKDATLSDEGKRRKLAAAYTETERRLAAHKVTSDQAHAEQAARLTRQAFGAPVDPIAQMSYRQAQQVAEGIDDPRTAQAKLESALAEGDNLLAQAIARHATGRSVVLPGFPPDPRWGAVVDAYTTANPRTGEALTQLDQMKQSQPNPIREAAFFMTSKPSELDKLQPHEIETLASDATADLT